MTFAEPHVLSQQYLVVNSETVISLDWLLDLDAHLVSTKPSFEGFTNARNRRLTQQFQSHAYQLMVEEFAAVFSKKNAGRWRLDLHRCILGFTLYAFLSDLRRCDLLPETALPWFCGKRSEPLLLALIDGALPRIRAQFMKDWMGHKNKKGWNCGPLCCLALGWDGNCKLLKYTTCDGPDGHEVRLQA